MAKPKKKTFKISEDYHLARIDTWWASLLRNGAKEIVDVVWEAQGRMEWKVTLFWLPVSDDITLNVGHPEYVDLPDEHLDSIMEMTLESFEEAFHELTILDKKLREWGVSEGPVDSTGGYPKLTHNEDLDDAERLILHDFLWPSYTTLKKFVARQVVVIQELEQEKKARSQPDYYQVQVDRGMLNNSFSDQLGYENGILFEHVDSIPPE